MIVLGWVESSIRMILGYRRDSPCTMVAAAANNDLVIESFAEQPDITFTHIYQAINPLTRRYTTFHTLSPYPR